MDLYGRERELKYIFESRSQVLVLTGDSGIGKSALLRCASRYDREGWLTAPVTDLQYAPGALHSRLIDQLVVILDIYLNDRTAVEATLEALTRAAKRIGNIGGKEIARAVGGELLNLLKSRLGPDFGDSIGRMTLEIFQAGDESLRQRLQNSSELSTAKIVINFAEEVAALTGNNLRLLLDRVERLSDSDKRILCDLTEDLPECLQLVLGWSTIGEDEDLRSAVIVNGAESLEIKPLNLVAIEEWLHYESVDSPAPEVFHRVTSGYPLFMSEAIDAARSGQRIENIYGATTFHELMKTSWRRLTNLAQVASRRLAVFPERPSDEYITKLLGLDQNAWSTIREELTNRHIFIRDHEGNPWFHDRRRDLLWRTFMSDSDRAAASGSALDTLGPWLESHPIPIWAVECMSDIVQIRDLPPNYSHLLLVGSLSTDSMAVLFALLELLEPPADGDAAFADTGTLLNYALESPGLIGDPVDALQELTDKNMVFTSANEFTSVTTISISNVLVYAAIIGRTTREFGRRVIPSVATTIFNYQLRPLVEPFMAASFGIGNPSLPAIALSTKKSADTTSANGNFGTVSVPPSLAITAKLGQRPFYAGIAFDDEASRGVAYEKLMTAEGQIGNENFEIETIQALPVQPVQSQKFKTISALLGLDTADPAQYGLKVGTLKYAEARVRFREALRLRMNTIERAAAGLTHARSIVVATTSQAPWSVFEAELSGGIACAKLAENMPENISRLDDPLLRFKISRWLISDSDERIERFSVHTYLSGVPELKNPYVETVNDITKAMNDFNKLQRIEEVLLDPEMLQVRIMTYRNECRTDAEELLQAGFGNEMSLKASGPKHCDIYISPQSRPWSGLSASTVSVPSAEDSVTVHILQQSPNRENFDISNVLATSPQGGVVIRRSQYAFAEQLIGGLLGFGEKDIRLVLPSR